MTRQVIRSPGDLRLEYALLSSPNPIRASAQQSRSVIDLLVMVSTATPSPVPVERVSIRIPVGQDGAGFLTSAPNLPSPAYSAPGWAIVSAGSVVTIAPASGGSGELAGTLVFTLPGIVVTQTPGTVQLVIVEQGGGSDDKGHVLVKWPSDFAVSDFHAVPPVLGDLDQPVSLHWQASDKYVYAVHSDAWSPRDCLNAGQCFTAADGVTGVTTPALDAPTTFALDVIEANPDGNRTIKWTVSTTARIDVPSISQNSYISQYPCGRLASLHWLALDASRCSVQVDQTVVDNGAPTDTYRHGYSVLLGGDAGTTHELAVVAHAQSGRAQASFRFPEVAVQNRSQAFFVTNGGTPTAVAITPDSTLGLAAAAYLNNLGIVGLPGLERPPAISLHGARTAAMAIGVTPDSSRALVTNSASNLVSVVDLVRQQVDPTPITVGTSPVGIAVTPDGTTALVINQGSGDVTFLDPDKATATGSLSLGLSPRSIALTPDGGTALIVAGPRSSDDSAHLLAVDVAKRQIVAQAGVNRWAGAIAVSPEGTVALIVNRNSWTVSVVDIARHQVATEIIVRQGSDYQGPIAVAVVPDGRYALLTQGQTLPNADFVSLIDISARQLLPQTIGVGNAPVSIAIAPNGSLALLAYQADNTFGVI